MDGCPAFFDSGEIVLHNPHAISARWDFHGITFTIFISFDLDMQLGPIATESNFPITVDTVEKIATFAEVTSDRIFELRFNQPNLDPVVVSIESLALLGELLSAAGLQTDLFDLPALLLPESSTWENFEDLLFLEVNWGSHMRIDVVPLPSDFIIKIDGTPVPIDLVEWNTTHDFTVSLSGIVPDPQTVEIIYITETNRLLTTWNLQAPPFDIFATFLVL